jgi:hypothetical protein
MDKALKTCPFCGGQAELKECHYLESELPYSYVHCTTEECTLNHNTAHFSSADEGANSRNAIAAWNKREGIPALHS